MHTEQKESRRGYGSDAHGRISNGISLEHAPKFKADKEVVLASVTQNGRAPKFASTELKADDSLVMQVLKQDACVLAHASPKTEERSATL